MVSEGLGGGARYVVTRYTVLFSVYTLSVATAGKGRPAEPTRHHATSLLYICMHSHLCSHSVIRLLGSLFNKSLISSRYSTPYFRDLGIFSYIAFLILSSQVISFSSFALYLVYGAWRRDVGGGHAPQRTYHSGSHHVNAIQAVERRCTFGPLASKSYSEGPETADLQLKIITF